MKKVCSVTHNYDPNLNKQLLNWGIEVTDGEVTNGNIEILIGGDIFWQFMTGPIIRTDFGIVGIKTSLGWTISGRQESYESNLKILFNNETSHTLEESLTRLWEIEDVDVVDKSRSQDAIIQKYYESIEYLPDKKKHMVNLLWKEERKLHLPSNYAQCKKRLIANLNKLKKDIYSLYNQAIMENVSKGFAQEVNKDDYMKGKHYLPLQGVIKLDRESTRLRVVYDGSAHCHNNLSLNECLNMGKNLNPDIFPLILRFREHRIGVTADISSAFCMIGLKQEECSYCRYLWVHQEDLRKDEPRIVEYEMGVVLFGLRCSTFLLASVIQEQLKKYQDKFPNTVSQMANSYYVDDICVSLPSELRAKKFINESRHIMQEGGMTLCKFKSNIGSLDKQEVSEENNKVENLWARGSQVFGVIWNQENDCFQFNVDSLISKGDWSLINTKRKLISISSTLYDPIGWLSPFSIKIKINMQELWLLGVQWDEPLPEDITKKWKKLWDELKHLESLTIPRWYNDGLIGQIKDRELHIFTDASMSAYATCAYLRTVADNVVIKLISSKTRVCPTKPRLSIPKLELCGALHGAKMGKLIKESINMENICTFYWTDSTIVLCWLRDKKYRWKQFVTNRVNEIKSLTKVGDWRFCPGSENPSDLPTRGISAEKLAQCDVWWQGPVWLRESHDMNWPVRPILDDSMLEPVKSELFKSNPLVSLAKKFTAFINWKKYSKLFYLFKVMARCLRFIYNLQDKVRKQKFTRNSKLLTTQEVLYAEECCIRLVQAECFSREIRELRKKDANGHLEYNNIRIFLSEHIVCVKSRIRLNPEMSEKLILLPTNHYFTELLVWHHHFKLHHSGVRDIMASIRENYWIPKLRQGVKSVIHSCVYCKRWKAKHYNVEVAPLPSERIIPNKPFSVCGLDFAGPIHLYDTNEATKGYLLLFSCATTRAIHLELVGSMSSYHFLLAFKRFIGRRNCPRTLISDNFSTFKKVNSDLIQAWKNLENNEFNDYILQNRIEWKFIVQYAPFWGGFYERMVRSMR